MHKIDPFDKKPHFPNLDGLRFLCFLMVFVAHSFFTTNDAISHSDIYQFVKMGLTRNGIIGVNFFFVLSGFLITFLLMYERVIYGKINIPHFWLRRVLRIWPLYMACIVFGFVIFPMIKHALHQSGVETASPIMYVTFLSNFDIMHKGLPDCSVLAVLWSVAIEEQFYFLWPIILSLVPLRKYYLVFIGIIAASIVYRVLNNSYEQHEYGTISCIGDMAVGGMAAWLLQFATFRNAITNIPRSLLWIIYLLFIAIFLWRDEGIAYSLLFNISERLLIACVAALIILEQSYCRHSMFKFSKIPFITRLGVISYGLYCLHFIGILTAIQIVKIIAPLQTMLQVFVWVPLLSLLLSILFAHISYEYFEQPFLRLKRKLEK